MMLGLPSLYETATGTFDIVRLVNVTHELLTRISKNGRLREELEDRWVIALIIFMCNLISSYQILVNLAYLQRSLI